MVRTLTTRRAYGCQSRDDERNSIAGTACDARMEARIVTRNGFNDRDNGYLLEWDLRTTPTTSRYTVAPNS